MTGCAVERGVSVHESVWAILDYIESLEWGPHAYKPMASLDACGSCNWRRERGQHDDECEWLKLMTRVGRR